MLDKPKYGYWHCYYSNKGCNDDGCHEKQICKDRQNTINDSRERRVMTDRVAQAKKRLEEQWSDQGDCGSCGWHGALHEYHLDDWEIEDALDNHDGWLEMTCINKDDIEDAGLHRGVKIYIGEPTPTTTIKDEATNDI